MRQKKGEGTKIAQAAKELGVTSVTIRRYLTEFDIQTTADENGIKVLPAQAMEELYEIRKLKEEGLTNPKVLEVLEEMRTKGAEKNKSKDKDKDKEKEKSESPRKVTRKAQEASPAARRKTSKKASAEAEEIEEAEAEEEVDDESEAIEEDAAEQKSEDSDEESSEPPLALASGDGKSKYSLTCQTCNKSFEHMNPRLRDCLDCYRIKRKERRRGGDKHKTVIQNPLAQQVLSKNQQISQQTENETATNASSNAPAVVDTPKRVSVREQLNFAPVGTTPSVYQQRPQIRSYRKAIEETRQITSNLKRRLERPDLPEAERRFLEQIYAYQLILHQGWKHLSEYRQGDGGSKE